MAIILGVEEKAICDACGSTNSPSRREYRDGSVLCEPCQQRAMVWAAKESLKAKSPQEVSDG